MASSDSILSSLAGSAIGDALGLPYENLSSRRAASLLGPPDRFRFILGYGMVSDDAEHACMTAAALATCGGDPDVFARNLARRLRWWLLTIPAGIGLATLKSILKLWIGFRPASSGVWSAGNGPAMRSAIIGRAVERSKLADFVRASTSITHRDKKAFVGAFAVALSSSMWAEKSGHTFGEFFAEFDRLVPASAASDELRLLMQRVGKSLSLAEATRTFAPSICRRSGLVSGYILETVPVALHAVYAGSSFDGAVTAAILCGGDTDSVASIVGSIRGAAETAALDRLVEWPLNSVWLRSLSESVARCASPPSFPFVLRVARNALMVVAISVHVVRRMLPPY